MTRTAPRSVGSARRVAATDWILRIMTTAGLGIDAVIHFQLAPGYRPQPPTVSGKVTCSSRKR